MRESFESLTLNESSALLKAVDDPRDLAIIVLFLNAGLFLNEIIGLKTTSIDWPRRILHVAGEKKRDFPLDEQTYQALAGWSRERPGANNEAFFLTANSEAKELSDGAVNGLIHKYAERAGIKRKINARILRNTCALRLCSQGTKPDKAAALLGITRPDLLKRYIKAAQGAAVPPPAAASTGLVMPDPEEDIFGREKVVDEIKANIARNNPTLLIGPMGIGKSHILKYVNHLYPDAIFIDSPNPLRLLLTQVLDRLRPDWKHQLSARALTKELLDFIVRHQAARGQRTVLIIDNFGRLKINDADLLIGVLDHFTIVTGVEETPDRLKQLWYKFKQIRLENLKPEPARQLIKHLTRNLAVNDYAMLETRVMTLSNGLPLAIVDMVHQVSHQPIVTEEMVRGMYHEAGVVYRDWTPFLIILWGVAMVFRFIALGTHSFEGYIIAGVGIAALMTTIRFLRMVK